MRLAATLSMARAFSLWRFRWDIGPLKQPGAARPQGTHPVKSGEGRLAQVSFSVKS